MQKLPKATKGRARLHPRDPRSPAHKEWRKRVAEGMRKGKNKHTRMGLVSTRTLAARYGFPHTSVLGMVRAGQLPAVEIGPRTYAKPEDFEAALQPIKRTKGAA